jgi:hypothetical protein
VKEEEHSEEERLDLAQQMKPWVYFYFSSGDRDIALQEWTTRLPQM